MAIVDHLSFKKEEADKKIKFDGRMFTQFGEKDNTRTLLFVCPVFVDDTS